MFESLEFKKVIGIGKNLVNMMLEKYEEYQGRGIGKKLIFSAIDAARKENAKVLEVGTGNSSIYQLGFYQKCGFRIVSIDRDFFKRNYIEDNIKVKNEL